MEQENKNKKRKSTGLADWLHFVESDLDAQKSERIVHFGNGRLSNHKPDNKVEITVQDIKNLGSNGNEK